MRIVSLILMGLFLFACSEDEVKLPEKYMQSSLERNKEKDGEKDKLKDQVKKPPANTKNKSTRTVKLAVKFRDSEFQKNYIRNGYRETNLGRQVVMDLIKLKSPMVDDQEEFPIWLPLDIQEVKNEALHTAQRVGGKTRKRFFKDLEIFLVFQAMYAGLNHQQKVTLITRWRKDRGKEPPEPKTNKNSPLHWLRNNPKFWSRGGHFWWWAFHALKKDPGFHINDKGRVIISLPESDRRYVS